LLRHCAFPPASAGAWIGTSEFADAAGFAAAQTYGNLASHDRIKEEPLK
jgi:hypothetical protein